MRTLLTSLGTVLGVGAFIATSGLADTARAQVSSRFDALKAREVRVLDGAPNGTNPFPTDVDAALRALNGVNHAGLMFSLTTDEANTVRSGAARLSNTDGAVVRLTAATPGALRASLPTVLTGALLDEFHEGRHEHVAVLGRAAANELGIASLVGNPAIFVGDVAFTVIGIIDDVGRNPDLLMSVVIPAATADARFDTSSVEREVVIDVQQGAAQLIGRQAPILLRPQDPERLVSVVPPDPESLRGKVEADVRAIFYALSVLALAVGALAIANATLLNVVERRPEIGLRRALGATRGHIARQVALEAAATGTIGGCIGGALGIVAVVATSWARGWAPVIEPFLILIAPIAGVATGALAGLGPGLKACRTPPAEALRS